MTTTKAQSLHPTLERRFYSLDKKLNILLEYLKDYSEDQLNRKPGPEKWSVIQVMHHLLLAESGSHRYLEKKLSFGADLKNAGVQSWFRKQTLKVVMKSPLKWKAPAAISQDNLPNYAGFWDTAKQWKEERAALKKFLSTVPADTLGKEAYKHSFAGRMNI